MTTDSSGPATEVDAVVPSCGKKTGLRGMILYIVAALGFGAMWAAPYSSRGAAVFVGAWIGTLVVPVVAASIVSAVRKRWSGFGQYLFWFMLIIPWLFRMSKAPR